MDDKEAQQNQQEIESEGKQIKQIMEMPGWDLIEKAFKEEIMDLQSIRNVDDSDAESALQDMKSRNMSVKKMMNWWRKIHGKVERKAFNEDNLHQDSHIRQFEE
jgi:hypothetical protein